jgi:hypothetical protein
MSGDVAIKGISAETDVEPSDIFAKLDFGFMLYMEIANPQWAITLDGLYMNLGDEGVTPVTERETEIDMKQLGIEVAGLWRTASWAEIGLGGRLNVLDGSLKIAPGQVLPGTDVSDSHPLRANGGSESAAIMEVSGSAPTMPGKSSHSSVIASGTSSSWLGATGGWE